MNVLSIDQIALQVRLAIIKALPEIIAQSVKSMEHIDGIKILQVQGLGGIAGGTMGGDGAAAAGAGSGGGNLADQAVAAALRYRSQAPRIDSLMKELGLEGGDLAGLAKGAAHVPLKNGQEKGAH